MPHRVAVGCDIAPLRGLQTGSPRYALSAVGFFRAITLRTHGMKNLAWLPACRPIHEAGIGSATMKAARFLASMGLFLSVLSRRGGGLGDPADIGEPQADQHEEAAADLRNRHHIHRGGGGPRDQLRRSHQH